MSTSAPSRTRPAASPGTGTPGCAGSPGTATTTCLVTSAAATSTCGTTPPASTGRRRGSPPGRRLTSTSAGTASRTPPSGRPDRESPRRRCTSCRAARTSRSGGSPSPTTGKPRPELSLFSSVEFALWDAQDDATNYQRNYSTGEVEVVDGVIYHKTEYRERRDHFAYFACSEPLVGFDTQREAFLGPYRGFHEPLGVERGELTNSVAHGWSPHGAHHVRLTLGRARPGRSSSSSATARTRATPSSRRRALSTRPSSSRSSSAGSTGKPCVKPSRTSGPTGTACSASCTWTPRTPTATGWSTSGTPTSAWSPST